MAVSEYKNGNFEEIGAWSQILQIVSSSTLFLPNFLCTAKNAASEMISTQIVQLGLRMGSLGISTFICLRIRLSMAYALLG